MRLLTQRPARSIAVAALALGCTTADPAPATGDLPSAAADAGAVTVPDDAASTEDPADTSFVVMTMNIGTSKDGSYGDGGQDGYGDDESKLTSEYYGNGLSWTKAEYALIEFLAAERPAVVVFQEGFFDGWCPSIPELGDEFVCHGYTPERPIQIERLVGPDYQVACARDEPDNCAGVRKDFARIKGCPIDAPCMDGLDAPDAPDGCSKGARVGGMTLELAAGGELVVVNVHGKSGADFEDMLCRVTHFEQIFEDAGDGQPAARGSINLVMGDINTDPFKLEIDPSASYWNDWVGDGKPFSYMSSGEDDDGPATYAAGLRIDHIVSDHLVSQGCKVPGAEDVPPVLEDKFWDHKPVLCRVALP